MPIVDKATLKTYFNHNDTPDEPEFIDLVDSMLNLSESGTQTVLGPISGPSALFDTYNISALSFSDINALSLTGSNQFGTSSGHTHSFSGSIHQSGGCDSYFLNNLSIGTTTSPQSCLGGLTIYKNSNISQADTSLIQARSSSLLISGAAGNQMTFDVNEIHQYGATDLIITSQGDSSAEGNIKFLVGDTSNHFSSSKALYLKYDGKVGIGTQTPARLVSIEGANGALPLLQLKSTGSDLTEDVVLSFNNDNSDSTGYSMGIDSTNDSFVIGSSGNTIGSSQILTITGSTKNIGIGTTTPGQKLTVVGAISASSLLYASASDAAGTNYHTLLVDTASGRFYHTGSYGGGGGGGTTVIPNGGTTTNGALNDIQIGSEYFSVGGGGFWQNHANGVELVTSADNVGVGTSPSSIHKLLVDGNGVFTGDVIAYYTSDKRLKDNIKPIEDPIGKIKQIGGYSFDWNDKQNTYEGTDFGVIAQEIEDVLPSLVQTREDGYKGVKYDKIVSLLIEAVKDQQKQIDELKKLI